MKICPSTTAKSVISQLTCITDTSIQVKRKYKMAEGGKVAKWWHVVSGDEGIMAKLEEEWGESANTDILGNQALSLIR